jgi:hypothetical protein
MIESSSWQPLKALLGHPWFSRVWTFQEYIVARKVTALLLYRAIPFERISEIAIKVLLAMPEPGYSENQRSPFYTPGLYAELWVEVLGAAARNGRLRDRTLFKQMPPITRHQCLDPRDRIFSLISLFGEHVQSAIRVDYTKSTEMVFAEAS